MRIKAKIDRLYDQPDSNLLAFASVTLDEASEVPCEWGTMRRTLEISSPSFCG